MRCDYAINEGGGDRLELADGTPVYQATVSEKMTAPFLLRVHGRAGHASMPRIADNALVNAAKLIERIAAYRPEPQIGPELEAFLRALLGEVPPAHEAAARVGQLHPVAGALRRGSARADLLPDDHLRPRRSGTSFPRSARSRSTAGSCRASTPSTSSR